jgi:glycosyl transferase family 1
MRRRGVLFLYASSEFPARRTVTSYIRSFARYSPDPVVFNNDFFWKAPWWLSLIRFDVVIFHHSLTTPWSRSRYPKKIERLQKWFGYVPFKIALFQDEYFNSDLAVEFINKLGIDSVFSVAPESEWPKIYRGVSEKAKFTRVLTGYIDPDDLPRDVNAVVGSDRPVDVGYRSDWTPPLFRLGSFGFLKVLIAQRFLSTRASKNLKSDIVVGRSAFLRGRKWLTFLQRCRWVLGVESGSSVLDVDGSVTSAISSYLAQHPNAEFDEVQKACLQGKDGSLALRTISPRHFEAIVCGCGQVLIEGEYDGVLKAGRHYLAVDDDFSNLEEVVERTNDEGLRRQMVETSYREVALNPKNQYPELVRLVWSSMPSPDAEAPSARLENVASAVQRAMNVIAIGLAFLLTEARRRSR